MSLYDYDELKNKALAPDATKADRLNLLDWFQNYGTMYWNGEYYDLDNGLRLYPIIEMDADAVQGEIIDAEIN